MKPARNSILKFLAALLAIFSLTTCAFSVLAAGITNRYRGYERDRGGLSDGIFSEAICGDIAKAADYYSLVMNGEDWTRERIADYEQAF